MYVFEPSSTKFTCDLHKEQDEKLAARTVVNKFCNNEQKHADDSVTKEQIVDFKKRQRKKE